VTALLVVGIGLVLVSAGLAAAARRMDDKRTEWARVTDSDWPGGLS
jgi:hypothetical protein